MIEAPTYAPGTTIWVDLASSDLDGAQRFYCALFGWDVMSLGPEAGGYLFFMREGRMVGGAGPLQDPSHPPAWTTYFATADVDASAEAIKAAGGQVIFGPLDVMESGRMAICVDAGGAVFGLWQAKQHTGMGVTEEPGSYAWTELATRDLNGAKEFYSSVLGWEATGEGYVEWKLGEDTYVGGAMEMGDRYPASVPPHWLVYFATTDADATLARAQELGAQALVPVTDIGDGHGRFAAIQDPQGAVFGIYQQAG